MPVNIMMGPLLQHGVTLRRILHFSLLLLTALLAIQCGGSSQGQATEGGVDTGNLKPKPLVRTKWVYDYTSEGQTTRVATEVTALGEDSWSEQTIVEGVPGALTRFNFVVIKGKTYIRDIHTTSGTFSYGTPGQRHLVESADTPFNEEFQQYFFGSAGFGTSSQRRTYLGLGTDMLNVPAGIFSVERVRRTSEYINAEGRYATFDDRDIWQNAEVGIVQEWIRAISEPETFKRLRSFSTTSAITISANQVSSSTSPLILDIPSGVPANTPEAVHREIYELALERPGLLRKGRADILLAQADHLYHHYYLYPQNLPTDFSAISQPRDIVALAATKDPYTFYFSKEQFSTFSSQVSGERSIIGIRLGANNAEISDISTVFSDTRRLTLLEVVPLSRAWFDGLQAGDIILKIAGVSVNGLNYTDAATLLPTKEGEKVTIVIERSGVQLEVNTASETHIASIMNSDIAYMNIRKFTATSGAELRKDFAALKQELGASPRALILDLRDNPGGSTTGTRELVDFLIDQDTPGQNLIYRIRNAEERHYLGEHSADNIGNYGKTNFVVLINDSSASASEITAGVLRHYQKATLLGKKSYGKGVSQSLFGLLDGSGLAITAQEILLPDDLAYHGLGLQPDIRYSTPPSSPTVDTQLQAAIEFINTGSVTGAETASSKAKPDAEPPDTDDPWIPDSFHLIY